MRFSFSYITATLACILSIFSLGLLYKLYYDIDSIKNSITSTAMQQKPEQLVSSNVMVCEETTQSKQQLWSSLQLKLKDTVAQVFAQIAEFNWIEPYKTPSQGEASGTAFFINDKGELITNAHVVDQAKAVFIQIPSLGKRRFEVDVIGVSPERDLALLRVKSQDSENIKKELKKDAIPFLKLGDSDSIQRADKLMALGYPLGQQGLKSTTGVVSGREHLSGQHFIQISAALNKGNSGGPSLNCSGQVIGVNSAIIQGAQNVGYIIPINEVKLFLDQLRSMITPDTNSPILLRKPFLGVLFNNANDDLTAFLKNPPPGGLYVVDVYKGSQLYKAGIRQGDMIYTMNNHPIDIYGEMNVPWSKEDKVSMIDYISRLKLGENIKLEYYRSGVKKIAEFKFSQSELLPIRRMYPGYEKVDYEVIAGIVVMPLTLNHIVLLAQLAPELVQYADLRKHMEPALLITHVLLNSPASRARSIYAGAIIVEVNGEKVKTLPDFRRALLKSANSGYLTIRTSENIFVVLPLETIMQSEPRLSNTYFYPLSEGYKDLESMLVPTKNVTTNSANN